MNTHLLLPKSILKFVIVLLSLNAFVKFSAAQPFSIVVNGPSEICGTNNTYLTVSPSGGTSFRWFLYIAYPFGLPIATGPVYQSPETGYWLCEVTTPGGVYTTNTVLIRTHHPYIQAPLGNTSCNSSVNLVDNASYVNNLSIYNSYQWQNNGSDISGATNYSYYATVSGNYTCRVSLNCGTGTSNSIPVQIDNTIPANTSITANGPTTYCSGGSVTLSVPNTSGWHYQWKKDATTISGATAYSYVATQAGTYTCVISNLCNAVTTSGVAVIVQTQPVASITANGGTTFCTGSSVTLTANSGTYTYQWKNGATAISGATNQSYTASSSGSYSCDVSNSCGTATSNAISVTVNIPPSSAEATVSAGGATSFCNGGSVVLTVATAGLFYQWKNGGSTISGATLQSFTASASGIYTCDVSNSCGTTTSNSITVTVNTAPTANQATITAGGPTSFCKGQSVVLTVATAGFTYQWKKGNNNISGATMQSYTASKAFTYKCVVSNSCGSITSNSITVTVNPVPTASVSQAPCSSGAVLLTCAFTPGSGVTFQWTKANVNISGATNSTYSATVKGTYKCIVTITATGCTKLSNGVKVMITCKSGDIPGDDKVIVYPNPASDYFNINTSQLDPQSVISIYDLTGRLVESHEVTGGKMQVGESLSNGVYFLKIESNHEALRVIKLVKNF